MEELADVEELVNVEEKGAHGSVVVWVFEG